MVCWIYGHTHTPTRVNKIIKKISFLCNPIGFPGENQKQYFSTNIKIIN